MLRASLVYTFGPLAVACVGPPSAAPTPSPVTPIPLAAPTQAALFAPGVVSTRHHELNAALAPDGRTLVFSIADPADEVATLLVTRRTADGWSTPTVAPFSGRYSDVDPSFSPDGHTLYFSSRRPLSGQGAPKDADLWAVTRTADGWGAPRNLGPTINTARNDWHATATCSGALYFSTWDDARRTDDIFRAAPQPDGRWQVENVGAPVNTPHVEGDPFIDPQERYLIFTSYRPGGAGSADLYVSFRADDGGWRPPVPLPVNTSGREYCPAVADGRIFFFTRKRPPPPRLERPTLDELLASFDEIDNSAGNVYWMNADFLDRLRTTAVAP